MFFEPLPAGDDAPVWGLPEPPPWSAPPALETGAALAVEKTVARSPNVVVRLPTIRVFGAGCMLDVEVVTRQGDLSAGDSGGCESISPVGQTESVRAELVGLYYRATRAPARRWLPIPVHALFDQATVTQAPGLTLVYGPGAPGHGNLLMSHSEVGAGTDQFGNEYQDGDTAYRDAFTRATPRGRLGLHIPDTNSSTVQRQAEAPHDVTGTNLT